MNEYSLVGLALLYHDPQAHVDLARNANEVAWVLQVSRTQVIRQIDQLRGSK